MVVVLPAPLGPRKAKISPGRTSNEIPPTAVTVPNVLTRFSTRIIGTSRLSIRDGAESARVRDLSPASLAEFAADVLGHRPGLLDRLPQPGRGHAELFAPVVHLPPLVHVHPRPVLGPPLAAVVAPGPGLRLPAGRAGRGPPLGPGLRAARPGLRGPPGRCLLD